ncbi:MAG: adenosylcobinamide-phosphate synthase CbiB [Methyloceanibacter sp.]|uniref:adenosylcobinamide-phosphate synthase CbiB n=1 Tax=Methyloceanibacter sp. TaxID=1965321 RepID=UPI003D9BC23D
MSAFVTLLALLIEAMAGYPRVIARGMGHPVTWMGRLIGTLDRRLNRDEASAGARRNAGIAAIALTVVIVGAIAFFIERSLLLLPFGIIAVAIVASTLLAQRSLYAHVANVAGALEQGDIADARVAVAEIVGRDTAALDEAGIARAAIESLAENFSDGVVAPSLWMVIAGLPGASVYKAINTADSMIGHRTKRHEDFGSAAARLDDLVNLPASRLAALLLVTAAAVTPGASSGLAWRAIWRDAPRHRSPNAGYPEAATAGALDLALGGPRHYDGALVADAWMGGGRADLSAADIRATLSLYVRGDAILIGLVALVALLIWRA